MTVTNKRSSPSCCELLEHAHRFDEVGHLVLTHFSPRYRAGDVRALLSERLGDPPAASAAGVVTSQSAAVGGVAASPDPDLSSSSRAAADVLVAPSPSSLGDYDARAPAADADAACRLRGRVTALLHGFKE